MGDVQTSVERCLCRNDTLLLPALSALVATETRALPQVCSMLEPSDFPVFTSLRERVLQISPFVQL